MTYGADALIELLRALTVDEERPRLLLKDYPDVTKPTQSVLLSYSRPSKTEVPSIIPTTQAPYVERTNEGERLPFCRRSGRMFSLVCENGHKAARHTPCIQLDCLTCRDGASFRDPERRKVGLVGRRRGLRLYKRMGGPDWACWVFTWPGARGLDCAQVTALRRMVHDAVAAFYRHFYGVEVGVHSYVHPCGDETQGWRPHLHVQVALLGLSSGELVELPYYLDDDQLAAMTELAGQVQAAAGIQGAPNAHYTYRREADKKLHRASYDGRSFPGWYAGDMPHSLRIARQTGLLAPRCRVPGIDAWREAVKPEDASEAEPAMPDDIDDQIRMGLRCYCCESKPRIIETIRSDKWSLEFGPVLDRWGYHVDSPEYRVIEDAHGAPDPGPPPGWTPTPPEPGDDIPH